MKSWTNIADKTLKTRLGYQTINQIRDNMIYALEGRPWRPTGDTGTWMVYKDANTYTVKAGYYLINNTLYQLVADLDWTWTASGQNRGMDDGGAGNAASTVYYLYGIVYSSAFGVVASATAPTARFDTNLSGASYDTNLYLGAVYNNASQNLLDVVQMGPQFVLSLNTEVGTTTSITYTSKTLFCPTTAVLAYLKLRSYCVTSAEFSASYYSIDGSAEFVRTGYMKNSDTNPREQVISFEAPLPTPRTGYIKSQTTNTTSYLYQMGWRDKYLGWN
jgi:hypothetical protein